MARLVDQILLFAPPPQDFSTWYTGPMLLPLVAAALIAYYGFRMSLAGRRLVEPARG